MIKLTIINKLIISYVIALLAIISISAYFIYTFRDASASFDYVVNNSLPSIEKLEEITTHRETARKNTLLLVLAGKSNPQLVDDIQHELQLFHQSLVDYQALVSDQTDQQFLSTNEKLYSGYMKEINLLIQDMMQGNVDSAKARLADDSELTHTSALLTSTLREQADYNYNLANQYKTQTFERFNRTLQMLGVIITLSILIVGFIAIITLRYIHRSLNAFKNKLDSISSNLDLTQRVAVIGDDEISSTANVFNALIDKFRGVLQELNATGYSVDQAATEIAASNDDLASRSETQASSLEETAASMNQLSATVKNNVENTRHVDKLMVNVSNAVLKTNNDVKQLRQTMNDISSASEQINGFTTVIEGISFQTNILALNAAVEAARAGEHGKGFAVVASEVRALSHRSSEAAKDIKSLVETTVDLINAGVTVTESVVSGMDEANSVVNETMKLIKAVSQASVEQSYGIEQINISITQMESVLQQNAAMVEEMSAAAASLKAQSSTLFASIGLFIVDNAAASSWTLNDWHPLPSQS